MADRLKPATFEYAAPESLDEVVALLSEYGDEAKVIAGGQSLIPLLAFRLASPGVLIDLNRVPGLGNIGLGGETLTLGALTRHRDVELATHVAERCTMLAEAVSQIGHVAIRNRGTVGGSIAHADPAAEWPSLLLALDGEVDVLGSGGRRTIAATDLFASYFTTTLEPTEIITEIRLSLPAGRVGSAFLELARRHGDFAIAGVGALLQLAEEGSVVNARVTLIGVNDTAVRASHTEAALVGQTLTDDVIAEAAESIDGEIEPPSDLHGSSEYRRHIAKVLTRRALARARHRADRGGTSGS